MIILQQPKSVLIVEDDTLLAQNIALQLAELGYGVVGILSNGEDAVAQIDLLKPDLILMDIMLAGSMDGIETARQLRLKANSPVVFLTAHADRELVERALATGPFAYLQKPLKQRELELTLELALLRHRMEEQDRLSHMILERRVSKSHQELVTANQSLEEMKIEQQRNQSSLRRFSDALDASADSIYLIDRASMRFVDVNQTACEQTGYSKSELLEMGPHDLCFDNDKHEMESQFDRIAATQDRFGIIDTYHKTKDQKVYPVEVRLRAMEADDRAIVVAIARDMTLRHQSERALRQSEEQFQQITQNLQHLLWLRDFETRSLIYTSHAFEKIWGQPVEQISDNPRALLDIVHPEDRERFSTAMQRVWADKIEMDEEFRLRDSDGKTRWIRSRTFPIHDKDGKVYRIGGVTEDITARKENDEKLRLSEEKFRMLFEHSPIGMVLINEKFRLLEINAAFCNMLGYNKTELIGKSINDITYPEDLNLSLAHANILFNNSESKFIKEKRYLHKNGDIVWGRLHSTIIHDKNQRPLFGLGMIEDIDQIKQAENVRRSHEAKQKKALVREVHHRIKNHLQGVVGLMQQHTHIDNPSNSIIEAAIAQINVVATIHGLQGNEASEDIDLLQLLSAIRSSVHEIIPARPVFPIKLGGSTTLYLNREESVPIALALNELMVNALKHGTGPMEISLDCNSDCAIIRIENQCSAAADKFSQGSGLELVQALLQTKGAAFIHEIIGQQFLAKILLTAPVIQLQVNAD